MLWRDTRNVRELFYGESINQMRYIAKQPYKQMNEDPKIFMNSLKMSHFFINYQAGSFFLYSLTKFYYFYHYCCLSRR